MSILRNNYLATTAFALCAPFALASAGAQDMEPAAPEPTTQEALSPTDDMTQPTENEVSGDVGTTETRAEDFGADLSDAGEAPADGFGEVEEQPAYADEAESESDEYAVDADLESETDAYAAEEPADEIDVAEGDIQVGAGMDVAEADSLDGDDVAEDLNAMQRIAFLEQSGEMVAEGDADFSSDVESENEWVDDAADDVEDGLEDSGDWVEDAAEDTGEFIEGAADDVGDAAEDAGEAIEDEFEDEE